MALLGRIDLGMPPSSQLLPTTGTGSTLPNMAPEGISTYPRCNGGVTNGTRGGALAICTGRGRVGAWPVWKTRTDRL